MGCGVSPPVSKYFSYLFHHSNYFFYMNVGSLPLELSIFLDCLNSILEVGMWGFSPYLLNKAIHLLSDFFKVKFAILATMINFSRVL